MQDIVNRNTAIPWYPQGIGSRTRHGYQNPRMLKSQTQSLYLRFCICGFNQPRMV